MIATGLLGHTLFSVANRRRFEHWTWLPENAASGMPLLILLHGVNDAGGFVWWQQGLAHETSDHLVRRGEVPPFALLIACDTGVEQGSGYCDWADGTTFAETYLIDELLPWARVELQPASLHIAGLSMGGYGALCLALRHPALFASTSAMSGFFSPETLGRFVPDLAPRTWGPARGDHDVAQLVLDPRRRSGTRIAFDCGLDDELLAVNREMHALLDANSIPHEYAEHEGTHDWAYWSRHLPDHIRFHLVSAPLPDRARSAP